MIVAVTTGVFLGTMYLMPAGDTIVGCQNRISSFFLALTMGISGMLQAMNPIFSQRAVHFRERKSKSYRESVYFAVLFIVEVQQTCHPWLMAEIRSHTCWLQPICICGFYSC
jgi:hypothetical protein